MENFFLAFFKMRQPFLLLVFLLLTPSLGEESNLPTPRKSNLVSKYLTQVLDSLFDQLTTSKLTIPEINLGEKTGKFTEVEISVPGKAEKQVDGVMSYGFKLDTNLTKIVIAGNYDVLYLDVPGLFPFFGKGKFCITLDMFNLNMKFTASMNSLDDKFDIAIPDFQLLVQNSTVKFENLMDDTHLADFLNELLSNLLPDVLQTISKPLIESQMPVIDYYSNGIIKCIKYGILLGTTKQCIEDLFLKKDPTNEIGNELLVNLIKNVNYQF